MVRKTAHRRHKRGGQAPYLSASQQGNPNLPYSAPSKGGRRRRMRGGNSGAPYSSASSYGSYVNGSENSQYDRVFSQAGSYASVPGNTSIGAQGQNANMLGTPNASSLSLIQNAGSKRRRSHKKRNTKKRYGGFLGQVINQAIVPLGLLGMQQTYRRNKHSNNKSRRHRRYK